MSILERLKRHFGRKERGALYGVYKITKRDRATGKIKSVHTYENLIPKVARALILENITDPTPSASLLVSHVALGTDNTAPADADTVLGTETYRNAVASRTNSDDNAFISGFFSATEVTGHFFEAGIFMDGTGSADTGVLLSHVAIDEDKDNTEDLTLDWEFQLRDA